MKHKKQRHDDSRKCLKYIKRNDLPRLKSYLKKYTLNINEVKLCGDNTLLHAACELGSDGIVRYVQFVNYPFYLYANFYIVPWIILL